MASSIRVYLAIVFAACMGAMLAGCEDSGAGTDGSATAASVETNGGLSISGSPAEWVAAGTAYSFRPAARDASGATPTFSIEHAPAWASFDAATGTLSGTPAAANVGVYSQIQITASDGAVSVALTPFSITVAPASGTTVPLTISGSPALSVPAGTAYLFTPAVTHPAGTVLTYRAENLPAWAVFDPATGAVSGTPSTAYVGTSGSISISVSDGSATATLAPFSISVTAAEASVASISWTAPDTSGTGQTVAGYHIYFGTSENALTRTIDVPTGTTSFVIEGLAPGVWYFAVADYTADDAQSGLSPIVSVSL